MKRAHDISEITSEGIVIPDSRISRLKSPSTSSGVSVVQANAGTPGIERKCREGKGEGDVSPTARRSRKNASRTTAITGVIPRASRVARRAK